MTSERARNRQVISFQLRIELSRVYVGRRMVECCMDTPKYCSFYQARDFYQACDSKPKEPVTS